MSAGGRHPGPATGTAITTLAVGAIGVVFGDIGTNPLFAMREAFESSHPIALNDDNVLGLLSLMFWSLILVVAVKYLTFVMRADNDGEGGILALAALVTPAVPPTRGGRWILVLIGLFGAALLYGDGVITPAISVLAAIEGTTVAAPTMDRFVVPLAVVVLAALFLVQHRGTAALGRVFGPVMIVWFSTLAVLGGAQIVQEPSVLRALNPVLAAQFFADNGFRGFLALGAVILVVVGGEALYADMGHFGRRPIVLAWYGLVMPSLILVYYGQGALLLDDPGAIDNPFYRLAPDWAIIPLVLLATMATVIASQALISAAFSLTRQAVQLGYLPRVNIRHTSSSEIGQIYIGSMNWLLMITCIALVLGFRESAALAGAYGLAVSATMTITTIIFFFVARERFGWPRGKALALCSVFLFIDLGFLGSTLFKIPYGGWLPLVIGALVFIVLATWRTGRRLVGDRLMKGGLPLDTFIASLTAHPPGRPPGASAYLFAGKGLTPPAMLAALRHTDVLHEKILIVSVLTTETPYVLPARRTTVTSLGHGFHQVELRFGFMEDPDVPAALAGQAAMKLGLDLPTLSYVLGGESLRITSRPGMARWREHLFAALARNATSAADYFHLPFEQTLVLGITVEL